MSFAGCDDDISPRERVIKNNRRRWSDSPTSFQNSKATLARNLILTSNQNLTQSLQDLSCPKVRPVSKSSSVSQNNLSIQSDQTSLSLTKSRDSGFNKSASCLSLNSTSQKFGHVKSKVKMYIQNIKDTEAQRKKSMSVDCVSSLVPYASQGEKQAKGDVDIIKMQSDLKDKDALIRALQGSYDDLLLKYAEAEIKIDQLRIRSVQTSPSKNHRSRPAFSARADYQDSLLGVHKPLYKEHLPEIEIPQRPSPCQSSLEDSLSFSFSDSNLPSPAVVSDHGKPEIRPKEVIVSAPLRPVQKLYSTSVRLDKVLPSLGQLTPKSGASKSAPESHASSHRLPIVTERESEEKEDSCDGCGVAVTKYYITEDTKSNNLNHATTDTGIEDCVTERDTAENGARGTAGRLSLGPEFKRVLNVPDEDAISKVHRWRESLPRDVTEPKKPSTKPRKPRIRRPATVAKTSGLQCVDLGGSACSCDAHLSPQACALVTMFDQDYAGSVEITDCDNFSSRKFTKRSPKGFVGGRSCQDQYLPKTPPSRSKHLCRGECETCGNAIVASDRPSGDVPSPSASNLASRSRRKARLDKTEKMRWDSVCPRKSSRCLRVGSGSNAYMTRAVLLDLLLNAQTAHSCCCCCQHMWRGREPAACIPPEVTHQRPGSTCDGENSLQKCLDEIQKIAWELKANLAASHEGLVNLSCRRQQ